MNSEWPRKKSVRPLVPFLPCATALVAAPPRGAVPILCTMVTADDAAANEFGNDSLRSPQQCRLLIANYRTPAGWKHCIFSQSLPPIPARWSASSACEPSPSPPPCSVMNGFISAIAYLGKAYAFIAANYGEAAPRLAQSKVRSPLGTNKNITIYCNVR